jgi:hypothetical protein
VPTRFLAGIKHPSALSHGRDYLAAHGSRREPAAGSLPNRILRCPRFLAVDRLVSAC